MSKVSGKPDSIGQYLKIDLTRDILGVSSTGFVIRTCCSDEQGVSSRPCALKRIQTMDEEPPDLAKLLHDNVVRLMHHWTEERALFLVMELMDGDLAMLMAGTKRAGASPFSLSVAVDIMLQIAKGMLHLHEMEVSHPHLKCDNVLYKLTENKAESFRVGDVLVKLGGFGCSRPADVNSKGWDILRFGLTCLAILTGDERSDDVSRAHMVPDMVVARSSIPETTPVILKDCIVSCLDMQSTFSDVVKVLLLAKSYLMQTSNDEIMFSSESIQTEIVQTKTEDYCEDESSSDDVEEIFAVHQLHPQPGDVSISLRATFIFFHGFHKAPEEWRRTWMTRDNKLVWPQKWLPEDLGAGNIRVLSVSFDADSNVSNNYNRHELGKNLVQKLVLSPSLKLGEMEDAIFLVGHSFGGVLIKSLVTEVRSFVSERVHNNSDQEEVMKCEKFLSSLAKIVFYSVPHVAPGAVEFENYISECRKIVALQRSSFLQSLCEDSSFTADMNQLSADFEYAVSEEVEILVFLEGKPMSRGGGLVTIKACEEITKKVSSWEWHKIDKDNHFEVCRPDSKNHAGYKILLNNLQQHINAQYGSTSTPSEVKRTSFKTIVWAVVAICKFKSRVKHSKPCPHNKDRQECDKIGSTDCIDHECSSELRSVLGKRQIDNLLPTASWRSSGKCLKETSSSHGISFVQSPSVRSESNRSDITTASLRSLVKCPKETSSSHWISFLQSPSVKYECNRSDITTISHSSGFFVPDKQTSSNNDQDEKLSVKDFEEDSPFSEVLEEHILAVVEGAPMSSMIPTVALDNWVACDKCMKRRLLMPQVNPDSLPKKWRCAMMDWLPGMDCCKFKEEETTLAVYARLGYALPGVRSTVLSRDQKPAENLKQDSDIGDKGKEIGRVRYRENLGKYAAEFRSPHFKWKLWMGTYSTVDEARRALDCAQFYAGQNKGEFYFKDSPALFAELGPLKRPLSSVSKKFKDRAFNVELKKRAKQVISA